MAPSRPVERPKETTTNLTGMLESNVRKYLAEPLLREQTLVNR